MRNDLSVSTMVGAMVAIVSFIAAMSSLVSENSTGQGYQIFWGFLILGPTAMISSMLGFSAWWLTKFLTTLFSKGNATKRDESGPSQND
ncbi:MAG: hypothetical protein NTY51_02975 [Deltaproteobacteria bacterium]|nr:hypothetical protein [Deltaproteobacteria bacterium]